MTGGELIAAPVWKRHSSSPVSASSASALPSNCPMNSRLLAVVTGVWPCAMSRPVNLFHFICVVDASIANNPPVWYWPSARCPLPPAPRQCATGLIP